LAKYSVHKTPTIPKIKNTKILRIQQPLVFDISGVHNIGSPLDHHDGIKSWNLKVTYWHCSSHVGWEYWIVVLLKVNMTSINMCCYLLTGNLSVTQLSISLITIAV